MMLANAATVFVVSHDTASIAQLSNLLDNQAYSVTAIAGSQECCRQLDDLAGSCIVLCGNLQANETFTLLAKLTERRPDLPVIVLTAAAALPFAVEAMRLGAADVLHEPPLKSELAAALERLRQVGRRLHCAATVYGRTGCLSELTPRESEVLRLLLSGYQNKSIGHKLGISERTVEVHRARMMRKLGVTSFAVLIRRAIDAGVEPLPCD